MLRQAHGDVRSELAIRLQIPVQFFKSNGEAIDSNGQPISNFLFQALGGLWTRN